MSLFGRNRRSGPRGGGFDSLDARYPDAGVDNDDLALLQQLVDAGADLALPRHVIYFIYFGDSVPAENAATRARANGYRVKSVELPGDYEGTWSMNAEIVATLDPRTVLEADRFFRALAQEFGGEYDGWEASVGSMSTLPPD